MRVTVRVGKGNEKVFDEYDDALDYIDTFLPEIELGTLNTDDIQIDYHD